MEMWWAAPRIFHTSTTFRNTVLTGGHLPPSLALHPIFNATLLTLRYLVLMLTSCASPEAPYALNDPGEDSITLAPQLSMDLPLVGPMEAI